MMLPPCSHDPVLREAGTVQRSAPGVELFSQGTEGTPVLLASGIVDAKRDLVVYACRYCGAVYSQVVEAT